MDLAGVAELLARRNWLKEAEADLTNRMETRIAALDGAWRANDPLYQRIRLALTRVRGQLAELEDPLAR